MDQAHKDSYLALDVGAKRIGVALASHDVHFAKPLTTLVHSEKIYAEIAGLVDHHHATVVVVGFPRGLEGQTTEQTKTVEAFVEDLKAHVTVPIVWQDESLTSVKAEAELANRNKDGVYNKADVDALAATYILEDFLTEHQGNYV